MKQDPGVSGWFVCNLGDAMLAQDALADIRRRVDAACGDASHQGELAAYIRHVSEGRLHCEVLVYFSPGAGAVAREYGALPCAPPQREGLDLLAGGA